MTDLLRRSPFRLPLLLSLTLLTVIGLATLWKLKLESYVMHSFGLPYPTTATVERVNSYGSSWHRRAFL